MSSGQRLIYDTDSNKLGVSVRTFAVGKAPMVVRASGLTGPVAIYAMVGECETCGPDDISWEPLTSCGLPVVLSPDNTHVLLRFPNKYVFGDPSVADLVLAGDINVTVEEARGTDLDCVECCPPLDPLGRSCDVPVHAKICNSVPVELNLVPLGCITAVDGEQIGRVLIRTTVDEETGAESQYLIAYYEDGTSVSPYTGAWSVCEEDVGPKIAVPNGTPIPDDSTNWAPAWNNVLTFTAYAYGQDLQINLGTSSIIIKNGDSVSYGNGDNALLLNVSGVSFTSAAGPSYVSWEELQ